MTTISPNYANVNFRATEQVQPKKAAETNDQSKPESKGMSNAMKAGIGLAALSVAVIGGLAAKKHIDAKNFSKNFVNIFEKHYAKIENVGKEMNMKYFTDQISDIAKEYPNAKECSVFRLNKEGLSKLSVFKGKTLPENLLGAKDGILIGCIDKNGNLIDGKGIKAFICDTLDEDLNVLFGKNNMVKVTDINPSRS